MSAEFVKLNDAAFCLPVGFLFIVMSKYNIVLRLSCTETSQIHLKTIALACEKPHSSSKFKVVRSLQMINVGDWRKPKKVCKDGSLCNAEWTT